ncbi:hypothetical protein NUM3379_22370 [Kineococcus sp. NUM-3379]
MSDRLLAESEMHARAFFDSQPLEEHPNVVAWREAYRAFGAKPQRTRPSMEALLRRVPDGLPRVDRITDIYNAVSVRYVIPIGGEDLTGYSGPARLVRAKGSELFEATAHGSLVIEHPEPGEVVWADDDGVTCRRWNWRQCSRTRITTSTTSAFFVFDALGSTNDSDLRVAEESLVRMLARDGAAPETASRVIGAFPA